MFRSALHSRRRVYQLLGALFFIVALTRALRGYHTSAATDEEAVARALRPKGFVVDSRSVVWIDPPAGPLARREFLMVARKRGELTDIYRAKARTSGEGVVFEISGLTNVTRSSGTSEDQLTKLGDHVVFGAGRGGLYDAFVLLDLRGEPKALTEDWPWLDRLKNTITNLQETGRGEGIGRFRYQLDPSASRLRVSTSGNRFAVDIDGARLALDPERPTALPPGGRVEINVQAKGRPGLVTWVVDTVRNIPWVGPRPIEWLEHQAFAANDFAERWYHRIFGQGSAKEIAAQIASSKAGSPRGKASVIPDAPSGWPPPSLVPPLPSPIDGEGRWIAVDDPFVKQYPNAPKAFYQTFVRADPERTFAPVYVTLWDPRQVQLHVMMGTREPESATGETGPGMVPRDPATLGRLVAAFNGGFQALHGEFGMMSEGRVYLPPKPWAATVAVFDDGRVGMGSWPPPPEGRRGYDEESANRQIPPGMVAMRQNLTSVVEDGVFNPWKRWWWGAAPLTASEQTFTHRTGLCLTKEGFLAYFWGTSMGAEALGTAMIAARCVRGLHLDMNSGHCGFEFYNVYRPGESLPGLGRKLRDSEYEGNVPGAPGYRVRARRAVEGMSNMRFPRYIGRDSRDFFYLTLKPVLPGPDVAEADAKKSAHFSTTGLPQAGWPASFARTSVTTDAAGTRVWLIRIDTSRATPEPLHPSGLAAGNSPPRILASLTSPRPSATAASPGSLSLFATRSALGLRYDVGVTSGGAEELVVGHTRATSGSAQAALGIDNDGFLLYAEVQAGGAGSVWPAIDRLGITRVIGLEPHQRLGLRVDGRRLAPDGEHEIPDEGGAKALRFLSSDQQAAYVLFPETKPVPYRFWGYLQGQRVRYVPQNPPRFRAPEP